MRHTIIYDINGGNNWCSKSEQKNYALNSLLYLQEYEMSEIKPPKGKIFDAYEIDGERYEAGSDYTIAKDTTIKFLWKEAKTKEYNYEDDETGLIVEFTDSIGYDLNLRIEQFSRYTDEYLINNKW